MFTRRVSLFQNHISERVIICSHPQTIITTTLCVCSQNHLALMGLRNSISYQQFDNAAALRASRELVKTSQLQFNLPNGWRVGGDNTLVFLHYVRRL